MVEIKIYVVTTELKYQQQRDALEEIREELLVRFGGLTVIPNCRGYWRDEHGSIIVDATEVWEIVTTKVFTPNEAIELGEALKIACEQKVQLVTVNGHPYFV